MTFSVNDAWFPLISDNCISLHGADLNIRYHSLSTQKPTLLYRAVTMSRLVVTFRVAVGSSFDISLRSPPSYERIHARTLLSLIDDFDIHSSSHAIILSPTDPSSEILLVSQREYPGVRCPGMNRAVILSLFSIQRRCVRTLPNFL